MKKVLKVEVVSDIACPWCLIGKKRIENVIETLKDQYEFELVYRPFQLDGSIPEKGLDFMVYFENKFGNEDQINRMFERVESVGKLVGINLNFRSIPRIPNTLALHCIIDKAAEEGKQIEVTEAMFNAYMVKPKDLTSLIVLQELMSDFGWSHEKTSEVYHDQELKNKIKKEIRSYQQMGVSGVPFFIFNEKYSISGAQSEQVFLHSIETIAQQMPVPVAGGEACDLQEGNC